MPARKGAVDPSVQALHRKNYTETALGLLKAALSKLFLFVVRSNLFFTKLPSRSCGGHIFVGATHWVPVCFADSFSSECSSTQCFSFDSRQGKFVAVWSNYLWMPASKLSFSFSRPENCAEGQSTVFDSKTSLAQMQLLAQMCHSWLCVSSNLCSFEMWAYISQGYIFKAI